MVAFLAARLIARAEATGVIPAADEPQQFSPSLLSDALSAFGKLGVGHQAIMIIDRGRSPNEVLKALIALDDEVETSPLPKTEWRALSSRLGMALLGRLVGISDSSIRRYSAPKTTGRTTPTDVAGRLHFLALVVAELAGGYNTHGIRRWFERPRSRLGGLSPAELLVGDWDPETDGPQQVRALAASLSASPAT